MRCPYGKPGDRLWVRETIHHHKEGTPTRYAADGCPVMRDGESVPWIFHEGHVPSIHMPRWASRLTLEITGVRIERVSDISNADAVAEGCPGCSHDLPNIHAQVWFRATWNGINEKRGFGWASNPWVWVIEFKRIEP